MNAPDASARSKAARVAVIVFVTVFLDLVGFGIIVPFMPLYVTSMGGSAKTVGVLFSLFSFTQLIATPILGRISDHFGRRRVILVSLAGNAGSMVLFAYATHIHALPLLFLSRILAGATAGNIAACQAAVADVTHGPERAKGMGRVGAAIGLGMVLGPVIGGWATHFGESFPPLAAAGLAAADLIAAFFLMPETRDAASAARARATKNAPPLAALLAQPRVATVLALYFLTFLYLPTLQVALPLLASARLQWNPQDIGRVFGLFGTIGVVVQGLLIGRLTRALGPRTLVIAGELCSAAGLFAVAAATTTPALIGGLTLLAIGFGVVNPVLSALTSEYAGAEQQGAVLGVAQSAGGLARTLGPLGAGFLYDHIAPGAAFVGGAISALCALALALTIAAQSNAEAEPQRGS